MTNAPTITIDLDGPHWLAVHQGFAGTSPEDLLRWFVEPSLLAKWWSQEANVDPRVGGQWEVRWPAMDWVLSGQIAAITPTSLVVSWAWAHELALPARALIVRTEPAGDGAILRILQGPYRQGDVFSGEDDDRASHFAGWQHFLPKLIDAIAASAPTRRS